ncbi:beta-galactosidase [Paenibacillus rhizosphaerae]|uniref:Beta-galactosidase n=1 Tax=Paenibacillus rhizosphaerae TaxID=297318 RepID=A0A839TEY2_9BACL|nr:beta-galactosidase [Paenibacillus rhizosphaerae]MBB3125355.1 beta-galactosidase [Paenibacillus rhizosphaerae]
MINTKKPKMWYGGDYNPDQWEKPIWDEDLRMFKLAGIDVTTLNVFAWAKNQPDEETYDFGWLDEIMDKLHEQGVGVCLATSTAAHPAWMARKYPDVLQVDFNGRKRKFGGRHNSCPNSTNYRRFAVRMAEKLAERYKDHPALLIWHINNEYGGAGNCYCDNCERAFREWLKARYGTLEEVNRAWNTSFWSHTFYDWDEIVLPSGLSEEWPSVNGRQASNFQGISLDYMRFHSDSLLECYKLEYEAVKKHTPDIPVTTNLMGAFKKLDYHKWAKHMDVVSWDNYPRFDTPQSIVGMRHDLMRGLKDGLPFMLMEQTPSQQNWQNYNSLKRPGIMRLWSYQAVARGADTIMFFQLRRSIGACEKFHGAVIEHAGHEHTRVFRECAQLGKELEKLGDTLLDARVQAKVAIVFDWENWWAIEMSSGPTIALNYVDEVHKYYDALFRSGIPADVIGVEADLSSYEIVIAPVMYMVKQGIADKLERYVEAGGTLITTFLSGIVDENDLVKTGGYPGELRKLLGIWAEEIDALLPSQKNRIILQGDTSGLKSEYECGMLCDLIHSEGAEVKAVYGDDFYRGMPALTVNKFGAGEAWYLATSPEAAFLQDWLHELYTSKNIAPLVLDMPDGVETTLRVKDGQGYLFVLNHNEDAVTVNLGEKSGVDLLTGRVLQGGEAELASSDLWILKLTNHV